MSYTDDDLDKVVNNYSNQIANLIEAKIKHDELEEGIEMDILLRALFLQINRKKKLAKFSRADLESMVTKSFNEYAASQNLHVYATQYKDPENPTIN